MYLLISKAVTRFPSITFIVGFCAAVAIALSGPVGYLSVQYERLSTGTAIVAAQQSREISNLAALRPTTWFLEENKLRALLEQRSDEEGEAIYSRLTDHEGRLIVTVGTALKAPVITSTSVIYDAGEEAGYLYISRSFNTALLYAGVLLIIGLLIGFIAYVFLRILPMRALENSHAELQTAHAYLFEEKERLQVTFQSIGDAIITTDAEMHIEYLNPIAEQLTGWTTTQAKGLQMDDVFNIYNEYTGEPSVNPIRECLGTGNIVEMENHTILIRKTDRKEFHIEDSAAPIKRRDGSTLGAVMVFHDVTERKLVQNHLQHIAFHDALTGLANRDLFRKKLSSAINQASIDGTLGAVLFMDLDRFKIINDSLGHDIGDELLILVAESLKRSVRENDTVSRMGGDEFTAILNGLGDRHNAETVAKKIIDSISQPFNIRGRTLHISTSVGITFYPDDGKEIDTLLKHADTAMYKAKESGRNNYQYYAPLMNAEADRQLQIDNALHNALEKNEYVVEYQPKLDLASGEIVGVEALLRWDSPEFGRVMPSDFIPLLENSGRIVEVGDWVLKAAIKQAVQWHVAGYPLIVSVNVSARQFREDSLLHKITTLLQTSTLPPDLLRLEITESLLMENATRSAFLLTELQRIGIHVSLDDFGTGYSSLSYLRRFPITELKLDRSFVVDLGTNPTANKIAQTVIDLGHALCMKVTAEGVETESQSAALQAMGCDEIQGYLLSRPLSGQLIPGWINSHVLVQI
jgi:diguanylate cyclase (GGDEF)-like protein/PAS domain S-box-containing protein